MKCFSLVEQYKTRNSGHVHFGHYGGRYNNNRRVDTKRKSASEVTLNIPENIEWLRFIHGENTMYNGKIDISKCKKLLYLQVGREIDNQCIIYPDDYVIPLIDCCRDASDWPRYNRDKPNVRFIKNNSRSGRGVEMYDIYLKLNKNIQDNTDKLLLCLDLDIKELNDKNEILFYKLMRYCFNDETMRNEKIKQCKTWWSLQSALWIQNCSDDDCM